MASGRRLQRKAFRALISVLRGIGTVALFCIDCILLALDVMVVNFQKTGLLKHDCRGRAGNQSRCRPCRKYAHRWLFRFVCPDVRLPKEIPMPTCTAGEQVRIYPLRGLLTILLLMIVLTVGLVGAMVL